MAHLVDPPPRRTLHSGDQLRVNDVKRLERQVREEKVQAET